MLESIPKRLSAIRHHLEELQLDALIVPRADEYLGEYVPAHNERLQWLTGFTGSAGVAVILAEQAALFVDGRYTVQAAEQIDLTLFNTYHLIEDPYLPWLLNQLKTGQSIGVDSRTVTYAWLQQAKALATASGITIREVDNNPIDVLWQDRPQPPTHSGRLVPLSIAGQSSQEKRLSIGQRLEEEGAQAAIITALDSIAWLLNVRGQDVPRLPVILSHAILYNDGRLDWFVDLPKVPKEFANHVGSGVQICPPEAFPDTLEQLGDKQLTIMADAHTSNAWCQLLAVRHGASLLDRPDPCLQPKACKNVQEIEGMRQAHLRDGVAMVRFLAWLYGEIGAGRLHDEGVLAEQLKEMRLKDPGLMDLSFDTISAVGSNAAMCHYNHLNNQPGSLKMNSLYLVDSGGQYECGTTDITRTIAIGTPTQAMIDHFTLVLKGMIALSRQHFPEGTSGSQLDSIARQFLWQHGLDYDHGTGHGVGHFLSVHEGPQRIAKKSNDVSLEPGMVLSNEPGYYKEGEYGIRCENLVVVAPAELRAADRTYYRFETLTWVPFDRRLIDASQLSQDELEWLNNYHQQVLIKLRPAIEPLHDSILMNWLTRACEPIEKP